MKKIFLIAALAVCPANVFAQTTAGNAKQTGAQIDDARQRRVEAYARFLEGQRFLWSMTRARSQNGFDAAAHSAKDALQKAVELDPNLAEAYTALAELALSAPPNDLNEALMLSNISVKINPDGFGGHRILARIYTIKSHLNRGDLNQEFAAKAIAEWKEIVRLDERNAEAFAFLSEFYDKSNDSQARIDALRRWIAASTPLDTRFYKTMFGGQAELTVENASVKLGAALLDADQNAEAVGILSRIVADDAENTQAMALLREAVETGGDDKMSSEVAVQNLTRAVYANPENAALVELLAQAHASVGQIEQAAKILRSSSLRLAEKDKVSAADLQITLGNIFAEVDLTNEALASYEAALSMRGVGEGIAPIAEDKRDFAIRAFGKMIQTLKRAERPNEAKAIIERTRKIFGDEETFAARQLIDFYRETGNNAEALKATRALRTHKPDDYGLLRLEATILTDAGQVDEAVALVKPLIGKKISADGTTGSAIKEEGDKTFSVYSPMYDDFTNYLFISNLYSQARRGAQAVEAANQAIARAQNEERKQIAKLSLATGQRLAGDTAAAETTLRALLKQSPGNPIALNNLGYFLVERGANLDEAVGLIERAVKIDPTNPSYLDSLGWAYFKLEKLEKAEKYLKDAVRLDSSSATVQEHLGDVYQKQGKIRLAKAVWQNSLKFTSDAERIARLKSKISAPF